MFCDVALLSMLLLRVAYPCSERCSVARFPGYWVPFLGSDTTHGLEKTEQTAV